MIRKHDYGVPLTLNFGRDLTGASLVLIIRRPDGTLIRRDYPEAGFTLPRPRRGRGAVRHPRRRPESARHLRGAGGGAVSRARVNTRR